MKEASKAVATQDPTPSTAVSAEDGLEAQLLAVAKTPQERLLAFQQSGLARQQKMLRLTAMAIAETGWGKEISPVARQAVARYCMEIGADPVRHVNVLGGNVYLNAAFWMEIVAANPKYVRAETQFIHEDKRADDAERERRKALRLVYGVPEEAPGAAVVTLFYDGRGPFIGVNWAGVRNNDPVGKQEPTKTAETRAFRRAAMKAEPAWFSKHPRLQAAQELLVQGRELDKAGGARIETEPPPVATESIEVAAIGAGEPRRTGVIENHEPDLICGISGDHDRETCGYKKAGKEPPVR